LDGKECELIAREEGKRALSSISLNRAKAKFIKMELAKSLNEELETPWSMQQLKLYGIKNKD